MSTTQKNQAQQSNQGSMPEAAGLTQPKQDVVQKNQSQSAKNNAADRDEAKRQAQAQGFDTTEPHLPSDAKK
jgi:hypothetical protein